MIQVVNEIKRHNKIVFFCHSMAHVIEAYEIMLLSRKPISCFSYILTTVDRNDEIKHLEVCNKLQSHGIKAFFFLKKSKLERLIGFSRIRLFGFKRKVYEDLGIQDGNYLLINFCWNQQFVCYPACDFYKDAKDVVFIQEGSAQYVNPLQNKCVIFFKVLYGNVINYWNEEKLHGIYVEDPDKYLAHLQTKLKVFKKYNSLSEEEKKEILDVFIDKADYPNFSRYMDKNVGLIFTQPLSEDGYVSEQKKKDIYKTLLEEYSKIAPAVLKVHPRDHTDYSDICDNVDYLKYPSEILEFLGVEFEYAIGVSTSAIYSVNARTRKNLFDNLSELSSSK